MPRPFALSIKPQQPSIRSSFITSRAPCRRISTSKVLFAGHHEIHSPVEDTPLDPNYQATIAKLKGIPVDMSNLDTSYGSADKITSESDVKEPVQPQETTGKKSTMQPGKIHDISRKSTI